MSLSLLRWTLAMLLLGLPGFAQVPPHLDFERPAELEGRPVVVEGTVLLPDGRPAVGAVVVSSAGGLTEVRADGSFSLEVRVSSEVSALQLDAVANGIGSTLSARRTVSIIGDLDNTSSGPMYLTSGSTCAPEWMSTFGGLPGVIGTVYALAVFDEGSGGGPALYVAGSLENAGGIPVQRIARWDGHSWSALGAGLSMTVYALSVFDDGSGAGPALYAGGQQNIFRWDGQDWSTLQSAMNGTVYAFAVFDDGSGSGAALYAGGSFTQAGGMTVNHIARWDGQSWSALENGTSDVVAALNVYDDGSGSGPTLYVGGSFTHADGVLVNRIAKWDGQSWKALGSGMDSHVGALTVFDDGQGSGLALYAGGGFSSAGGQTANRIARWDGHAWSNLGSGVNARVFDLAVFDDGSGSGPSLYAGGEFWQAGGQPAHRIAKWDGQSWSALGQVRSYPYALAVFDAGSGDGPELHAGGMPYGDFQDAALVKWDGQAWSALESRTGANRFVLALKVFDDGSGGGPALYVGGTFTRVDGLQVNRIAKWDGQSWSALGSGMTGGQWSEWLAVTALEVHDDGSGTGPALFAGGSFTYAGGLWVASIAKWDGQAWSSVGGGMYNLIGWGSPQYVGMVADLAVFDDGSGAGPQLYAGGYFNRNLSGGSLSNFAKWDGQTWSTGGLWLDDTVGALCVFDDSSGSGPALYVGGRFSQAGGQPASRIAKWDGQSWSALANGLSGPIVPVSSVDTLAVFDGTPGTGPALYAGGFFTAAGGLAANNIARWDGQTWSTLGSGVSDTVYALTVFDDGAGRGPLLHVGGSFRTSPGGDSFLTQFGCAAVPPPKPFCFGSGSQSSCPCLNPGAPGQGCANGTGAGAVLSASGSTSVAAGDLVLSAANLPPGQVGLYFQGTLRVAGGSGTPFGDGLFCAGGPLVRLELVQADAAGHSSTTVDIASQGGVGAAKIRTYQLWYRDPLGSPCISGFNLSNGLEVLWVP